tara:strand:- start:35 stop:523 length:489 start_codon:yes stop_codon:yes gene_type:complete
MTSFYNVSFCDQLVHLSDRKPTGTKQKKTTDKQLDTIRDALIPDVLIIITKTMQQNKVKKQALSNLHKHRTMVENKIIEAQMLLTMVVECDKRQQEYMVRMQSHGVAMMTQYAEDYKRGKYYTPTELRDTLPILEQKLCEDIKRAAVNNHVVQSAMARGYLA